MEIKITFPGGMKVEADIGGLKVTTDQPMKYGGDGTAPTPYEHFLASIGTCAGTVVLGFCQKRGLSADGITLSQRMEFVPAEKGMKLGKVSVVINLPPDFPEKYRDALIRATDRCSVKKAIMNAPAIEVSTKIKG